MESAAPQRITERVRLGALDRWTRIRAALIARPIWWSVWITVGFASLLFFLLTPTFNTNDDVSMMFISNGSYFGEPQPHLVFTNPIIGGPLAALYSWIPAIPWYPVYLYALSCVTLFVLVWLVLSDRRSDFGWRLLGLAAVVAIFTAWVWMNLQFTAVAIALGAAGVMLYAATAALERIPAWVMLGAGVMVGAVSLVRWRSFQAVVVLAVPIVVMLVRKVPWKRQAWFACGALAVVLLGIAFQAAYYAGDDDWNDFFAFNEVRGTLHSSRRLTVASQNPGMLAAPGWNDNDLAMFQEFFYVDESVYNTGTLTALREETGNPLRNPFRVFAIAAGVEGVTRMALLAALGFWAWAHARPRGRFVIPAVILWFALVSVALVVLARLPDRVAIPILAMLAFFLLVRPGEAVGPDRDTPNPRWVEITTRAVLATVAAGAIGIGLFVTIDDSGHNDAANNTFFALTDKLGAFDPDGVFVSIGGALGMSAVSPEAGRDFGATIIPLGWHQQSPMFEDRLDSLAIDDLYLAIANNPTVYVPVLRGSPEPHDFATYVGDHYGLAGDLRPKDRVGIFVVYDLLAEYSVNANGALREDTIQGTVRYRPVADGDADGVWSVDEDGTSIKGWVINQQRSQPADLIVVFAGDEVIALELSGFRRSGVAERRGLQRSATIGFKAAIGSIDPADIRVFAVVGNRSFEVPPSGS